MTAVIHLRRRQFLQAGLVAAGAAGIPFTVSAAPLQGHIYAVTTLNPDDPVEELSGIADLDLATGKIEYSPLPGYRFGHSLVPLPDGNFFAVSYGDDTSTCIFLDNELNVEAEIPAPDGYGFAGHAALLPDGKQLVSHLNQGGHKAVRTPDQTGELCVIDVETRGLSETRPTDILHGHDVILSGDGRYVIVSDNGILEARAPEAMSAEGLTGPYAFLVHNPSLTLFDARTLEKHKTISLPINGSLAHLVEGNDGDVFGAVEQYVGRNNSGLNALRESLGDDVERYVDGLDLEVFFAALPYPGPIMKVDLEAGEISRHEAPFNQAPFDIEVNKVSGRVVNVFTASNMLARYNPLSGRWGYFSTENYVIKQPYGVTDIEGTTMMAVNGFFEGIAVIDVMTMDLIKRFETGNFGIQHMLFRSS